MHLKKCHKTFKPPCLQTDEIKFIPTKRTSRVVSPVGVGRGEFLHEHLLLYTDIYLLIAR